MADKERNGTKLEIEVKDLESPERVDSFLSHHLQEYSRSAIQKWIEAGHCHINGRQCKARDLVKSGDVISLARHLDPKPQLLHSPRKVPLHILYEDEDLLVLNKQAGLVVHPGAGTSEPTMVEGVLHYLQTAAEKLPGPADRPGIVHRLDKDTTGAIVVCKTFEAYEHLSRQFRDKTNLREYVALLNGVLADDEVVVESYLTRDERNRLRYKSISLQEYEEIQSSAKVSGQLRYANTSFYRRAVYGQRLTLVTAKLATGRTHQIRIHAQSLKAPVWGDPLYGRPSSLSGIFPQSVQKVMSGVKRQLLHARKLGFRHPRRGIDLAFVAPLPDDFRKVLEILNESGQVMRR